MSSRRAFPAAPAARLALFHGAVVLASLLCSPRACFAAFLVSVLALLRYCAMATFASCIGSGQTARSALVAGAWIAAGLAMAVALAGTARLVRPALPWAAAAALAGPIEILFEAFLAGFRKPGTLREREAL